ncbi:threonine/homoserine/homoserine lactone efflux protein [Rhodoligotrophos appendicifer]|uniref:LysE family translocator n=1 Tax=Rhodoligotrophos appendicifer TaxID=987056 RepID=UPI0011865046|nr:LysE family translocator [Rhodoligotrophos appendicifer]
MAPEQIAAIAAYAFASSITPGPNNTMLMASGVNFGFQRSIPHMLGVCCGFSAMLLALGCGIGSLFQAYPALHDILRYVGGAYMLYLAWIIATAHPQNAVQSRDPISFLQAAAFQLVNPKAWMMAIGAVAGYVATDNLLASLAVLTGIFAVINALCIIAWTGGGVALRRALGSSERLRLFNVAMALLLVVSLIPMVFPHLLE